MPGFSRTFTRELVQTYGINPHLAPGNVPYTHNSSLRLHITVVPAIALVKRTPTPRLLFSALAATTP